MNRSTLPTILLCILAAACEHARIPTTLSPDDVQFAKPGSSTDTDPRARWEYLASFMDANGTSQTAKLAGDGRDVLGAPTADGTSLYQGDQCGVHAKIFVGNGGGDAVLDPDKNYKARSCDGGARYLRFDLGSGTVRAGAFTNARGVWHFTVGESRVQTMVYQYNNIPSCERLIFESANGLSPVRVTRVDDGTGAKQWMVESLPNGAGKHLAGCYNWKKGKYVHTGPDYELPFSARITEVK